MRRKIEQRFETNVVLKPSGIDTLIKKLQRLRERHGNVYCQFTDELSDLGHCEVTLNITWGVPRWETDVEMKERQRRELQRGKAAAERGAQEELLRKIRERGAADVGFDPATTPSGGL